jgi:hypothetical protein
MYTAQRDSGNLKLRHYRTWGIRGKTPRFTSEGNVEEATLDDWREKRSYAAEYMKARLRAEQCPPRAYNRTGWITRTEARMREYISFDSHKYYTLMGGLDG